MPITATLPIMLPSGVDTPNPTHAYPSQSSWIEILHPGHPPTVSPPPSGYSSSPDGRWILYRIIRSVVRRWVLQYLDSQFADVFVVVVIVAPRRPTAATAATAATADDATPSFGGGGGDDDGGGGEHLADLGTTRRRRATTTHERRNDAIFVDTIVFISLFVSNYYSFVHRLRRSKAVISLNIAVFYIYIRRC